MERQFAPVIVFSFSKKDCEMFAMAMAKLDFNNSKCNSVLVSELEMENFHDFSMF